MTVTTLSPPPGLATVQQEIARACRDASRDPAEVTLVAVSKTFPPEAIEPERSLLMKISAGRPVSGKRLIVTHISRSPLRCPGLGILISKVVPVRSLGSFFLSAMGWGSLEEGLGNFLLLVLSSRESGGEKGDGKGCHEVGAIVKGAAGSNSSVVFSSILSFLAFSCWLAFESLGDGSLAFVGGHGTPLWVTRLAGVFAV